MHRNYGIFVSDRRRALQPRITIKKSLTPATQTPQSRSLLRVDMPTRSYIFRRNGFSQKWHFNRGYCRLSPFHPRRAQYCTTLASNFAPPQISISESCFHRSSWPNCGGTKKVAPTSPLLQLFVPKQGRKGPIQKIPSPLPIGCDKQLRSCKHAFQHGAVRLNYRTSDQLVSGSGRKKYLPWARQWKLYLQDTSSKALPGSGGMGMDPVSLFTVGAAAAPGREPKPSCLQVCC